MKRWHKFWEQSRLLDFQELFDYRALLIMKIGFVELWRIIDIPVLFLEEKNFIFAMLSFLSYFLLLKPCVHDAKNRCEI